MANALCCIVGVSVTVTCSESSYLNLASDWMNGGSPMLKADASTPLGNQEQN